MKSKLKKSSVFLSSHVRPERYKIHLEPNIEKGVFSGMVELELTVHKATKEIHLHANELRIETAVLTSLENTPAFKIEYDKEEERVMLRFEKAFSGRHNLAITYSGVVNDLLVGFYRSVYMNGKEKNYIGTPLHGLNPNTP